LLAQLCGPVQHTSTSGQHLHCTYPTMHLIQQAQTFASPLHTTGHPGMHQHTDLLLPYCVCDQLLCQSIPCRGICITYRLLACSTSSTHLAQQVISRCRGEYVAERYALERAVKEAYDKGFIGKNACGSGIDFDINVTYGAGAYICGGSQAVAETLYVLGAVNLLACLVKNAISISFCQSGCLCLLMMSRINCSWFANTTYWGLTIVSRFYTPWTGLFMTSVLHIS